MDDPYDFYQFLNFEGPESSLRPHWSTRVYFGAKGRVLLKIARVLVFQPDKIGFSGSGSGFETRQNRVFGFGFSNPTKSGFRVRVRVLKPVPEPEPETRLKIRFQYLIDNTNNTAYTH